MNKKPKRKSKGGPPKPKADDATIEWRVQVILQLKLDGAQLWDMCHYVSEREKLGESPWTMDADRKPLSERTIRRYAAAANERIAEACLTQEQGAIYRHISQRHNIYAKCIETGDLRGALMVLQDLAHLADLYPVPKKQAVELSGDQANPLHMHHGGAIETKISLTVEDAAYAEHIAWSVTVGMDRLAQEVAERAASSEAKP